MQVQRKRSQPIPIRNVAPQVDAHCRYAATMLKAGRPEQAVSAYSTAIRLASSHTVALHGLGVALQQAGRPAEAIAAWQHAVQKCPDHADSSVALAEALLKAGRTDEAVLSLLPACGRHPGDPRLLVLNGQALLSLGRSAAAIGALFMALDLQPGHADTHTRLAYAFHANGDMDQVLVHCMAAYELAPDHGTAAALAGALGELEHYAECLVMTDHVLALSPGLQRAMITRAMALDGLLQYESSLSAAEEAVAAGPNNSVAQHNLATFRLSLGQLTPEAWAGYEYRLGISGNGSLKSAGAQWAGEDLAGRTILLHAEQGLGDTLQFARYAPLVAARGGRVILAVQPALTRLLSGTPGVEQVIAVGATLPAYDFYSPLLSLPRLFGTTMDSIPPTVPYADRFEPWDDEAAGLRVGLVWAGGTLFGKNRVRSLPVAELAGLAGIPGVQFYSLQRHEGLPVPLPPELGAIDLMLDVGDFADTAALIAGLDLVIAVDTAVAHLAATMGKPVWLLSRFRGCWRWLNEGEGSPWYPSLRVLRQATPGGWAAVIAQVRDDLAALASQPITRSPAARRLAKPPGPRPCKACDAMAAVVGAVDFNKSCEDRRKSALPPSGRRVVYHRCPGCALVFTCDFDDWNRDAFRQHIYNEGYAEIDPDYAESRPAASAQAIGALLGDACRGLVALDYGGGNGALAALLSHEHGMAAETYDPFNPACDVAPAHAYPLVTCFEVLEHSPDPRATISEIAGLVQADGLVVFSVLLQPEDFARQGLNWWYVAPRNGHVTIYSVEALHALWREHGFTVISRSANLHVAFREPPSFAHHLAILPP